MKVIDFSFDELGSIKYVYSDDDKTDIDIFHPLEIQSDIYQEECFIHYIKYGRYIAEWWLTSELALINITEKEYLGEADPRQDEILRLLVTDAAAIGWGRTIQAGHSA